MSTIKVDVVSAEEQIFSGDAEFVALPGQEGELGILPQHTPLISLIKPGFVRITMPGSKEIKQVFVAGGVIEVQPYHVTVLADTAIRSEEMDRAKTEKAIADAAERSNGRHAHADRDLPADRRACRTVRRVHFTWRDQRCASGWE